MLPFRNPLDDAINKAQGNALKVPTPTSSTKTLFTLPTKSAKKVTKWLEQAQGVSFAPTTISKEPVYTPKDQQYFVPWNKTILPWNKYVENNGGSTVSKAYLDYASPTLTSVDDHIKDLDKNKTILKALKAEWKLSEEDKNQLLKDRDNGITQAESLGKMMEKKRYQLGTLKTGKELKATSVPFQWEPDEIVNENNISSLMDKSEMDNYIKSKKNPVLNDYITKELEGWKSKEQVKADVTMKFLQKDIEDELYANKNMFEKWLRNAGVTLDSTVTEIAASIPRLLAFVVNSGTWDGIEQNKAGRAMNEWTDELVRKHYKSIWADTGEVSGDMDNALVAGNILGTIIPFFLSGWVGSVAQSSKLATLATKFPKIAKTLQVIQKWLPALEKDAKASAKFVNYLQRFGGSLTRNAALTTGVMAGDTGVWPTGTELAVWTLWGVALEWALPLAGKWLNALWVNIGLSDILKSYASKKAINNAFKEAGIDGTFSKWWKVNMKSVWDFLRTHTRWGTKEQMAEDLWLYATRKSADAATKTIDGMTQGKPVIRDTKWNIRAWLNKVKKKLLSWETKWTLEEWGTIGEALQKQLDDIDNLLNKLEAEWGLTATEANWAKRLMDDNLDMYTIEWWVKVKQQNNADLRKWIKDALVDEWKKHWIDLNAINDEVIKANVLKSVLEKEMLRDTFKDMTSSDILWKVWRWWGKQLFWKGVQSQVWPFSNDTPEGMIWNVIFWQTAKLWTKIPWFAIEKTIWMWPFKQFVARMLSRFTPAEKWALEKFINDGKSGKFNRTWWDFTATKEWASAADKMNDWLLQLAKENNIQLWSGTTDTMLPPPAGKTTSSGTIVPTGGNRAVWDTVLPWWEKSVPTGTQFPPSYDNTITGNSIINGIRTTPQWNKTQINQPIQKPSTPIIQAIAKWNQVSPLGEKVPVSESGQGQASKDIKNSPIISKIAKKQETPKLPVKTEGGKTIDKIKEMQLEQEDILRKWWDMSESWRTKWNDLQAQYKKEFIDAKILSEKKKTDIAIKEIEDRLKTNPDRADWWKKQIQMEKDWFEQLKKWNYFDKKYQEHILKMREDAKKQSLLKGVKERKSALPLSQKSNVVYSKPDLVSTKKDWTKKSWNPKVWDTVKWWYEIKWIEESIYRIPTTGRKVITHNLLVEKDWIKRVLEYKPESMRMEWKFKSSNWFSRTPWPTNYSTWNIVDWKPSLRN